MSQGFGVIVFLPTKVWCETMSQQIARAFLAVGKPPSEPNKVDPELLQLGADLRAVNKRNEIQVRFVFNACLLVDNVDKFYCFYYRTNPLVCYAWDTLPSRFEPEHQRMVRFVLARASRLVKRLTDVKSET